MEYTFTLKYRLAPHDSDPDVLVERLGASGCDDALVGTGKAGRLALEFTREARNAAEAVRSALADVQRAIPSAQLIEASPDLVGLSDIAEIAGISRQAMRKLMLSHPDSFPVPVHDGNIAIWHLADLLSWLKDRGDYLLTQNLLEVARATLQVNIIKEGQRLSGSRSSGSFRFAPAVAHDRAAAIQ